MHALTRVDDLHEAIEETIEGKLAHLHTAVPCKIVDVDFEKQTCTLQPLVKVRVIAADASLSWVSMPPIPDAPLHFPSGGGVTMTFPVKAGDEALAIIASRSQDLWQQQGGEQDQIDLRQHDLSNAFALVGFKSNPKALTNVSSSSTQIRSDDGNHVVDIHPTNGLTLSSSQGVTMKVGSVQMAMTAGGVAFTSPSITANGHAIDHTHEHTGVFPGGANTGPPA